MADIKGSRIKALRRELDLSQDELAARIGVSKQAVLSYENGKRNPEMKTIVTLARALSCTTDYLFGASDSRQNAVDTEREEWTGFSNALAQYDDINQTKALSVFTDLLNSTANHLSDPYKDRLFAWTVIALRSRAEYNAYIQSIVESLEENSAVSSDKAFEIAVKLWMMGNIIVRHNMDANDTGLASIATYFPEAYELSKRLFGLKDSGKELEEFHEICKDMLAKKARKQNKE